MNLRFTPIILPVLIASLIAIYVLLFTWQRRAMRGARPLIPLLIGIVIWLIGSTIEGLFFDYETRLFWVNVQYIGIVIVPTAFFIFSLMYTGRTALISRGWIFFLVGVPIVTLVIIWTNPWHELFRVGLTLNTSGAYPFWERTLGPAFWLHTIYSYLLLISGTVILARAYQRNSRLYRRQISVMLVGAIVPWFANILFVVVRSSYFDFTPIAFLITGSLLAWGIFKAGLVEITPIIRRRVIDEMQDGVLVLDEHNRILEANPAVLKMLDAKEDVLGKSITEVIDRWPHLPQQFQNKDYSLVEVSLPLEGQETRHYEISVSPLRDRKGIQTGRLIMAHEVTHQKQIEASLNHAKEVAEGASRAKSTFLATMSHELRTPLAAIIGYSELIQEKSELLGYEKIVPHLSQIGAAARNLNGLLVNILDLSKIEAERMDIMNEEFSISALITEIISSIQPQIKKYNNTLKVDLGDDLGIMHSDRTKMRQILVNLLGNAAKFTHDGTISLGCSRDDWSNSIQFTIKDTGEGIPEEMLAKIFQPFVQVDSSFSRVHGGSGLGLAISSRFCQMLGGSITVESKLGEGTTFFVIIPVQTSMVETAVSKERPS